MALHPTTTPPPPHRRSPHVAVLAETNIRPGRDIVRGIAQYVRETRPWTLHHDPRLQVYPRLGDSGHRRLAKWLENWPIEGIIARIDSRPLLRIAQQRGVPIINTLNAAVESPLPIVQPDESRIGAMAAEHFLERGFGHFGFVGFKGLAWAELRAEAFKKTVEAEGFGCRQFGFEPDAAFEEPWGQWSDRIGAWLVKQPRPIGVLLASDYFGPHAALACQQAGLSVPQDVALLGVDDDEALCEASNPPLSSIVANHQRVGYEAARLLDRAMGGQEVAPEPLLIPPSAVVVRQSSDVTAVADPLVAQALSIIRAEACLGLSINELVDRLPTSRSVLQRRFRGLLGQSIHEQILSTRLSRARQLLAETDLPLNVVADRVGFQHAQYMWSVFRQHLDTTPSDYRSQHRVASPPVVPPGG